VPEDAEVREWPVVEDKFAILGSAVCEMEDVYTCVMRTCYEHKQRRSDISDVGCDHNYKRWVYTPANPNGMGCIRNGFCFLSCSL
jgi:hypothetical protein